MQCVILSFPLRQQVDDANRARLAALPGEEYHFFAIDDGEEAPDRLQKTLENVMAPKQLVLKLNAQVMLLKNMENGLVNGSVGKIVAFKSLEESLEEDDADASNSLFGQDAEKLRALALKKEKESGKDGDAVKKAKNPGMVEKAPVVEWKMPDGSRMRMRMSRDEFKVDDIGDKVKARRKQVGLHISR
jgi:ATP-dependent DNA helicase PIF1